MTPMCPRNGFGVEKIVSMALPPAATPIGQLGRHNMTILYLVSSNFYDLRFRVRQSGLPIVRGSFRFREITLISQRSVAEPGKG